MRIIQAWRKQYAYHATIREFLPAIAKGGLRPSFNSDLGEEVIFVEPVYEESEVYLEPGRGVMLRFLVDGFGDTPDGEFVLYDVIPPSDIEVEVSKGEWQPISEVVK